MERCEVQGVEPLFWLWWSVDPVGDAATHLLLDILNDFRAELLWVGHPVALHLLTLEMLCHALLVIGDKKLTDCKCIVICRSVQQIMAVFVHDLCDGQWIFQLYTLQDRLQLVNIEWGQCFKYCLLLALQSILCTYGPWRCGTLFSMAILVEVRASITLMIIVVRGKWPIARAVWTHAEDGMARVRRFSTKHILQFFELLSRRLVWALRSVHISGVIYGLLLLLDSEVLLAISLSLALQTMVELYFLV